MVCVLNQSLRSLARHNQIEFLDLLRSHAVRTPVFFQRFGAKINIHSHLLQFTQNLYCCKKETIQLTRQSKTKFNIPLLRQILKNIILL